MSSCLSSRIRWLYVVSVVPFFAGCATGPPLPPVPPVYPGLVGLFLGGIALGFLVFIGVL